MVASALWRFVAIAAAPPAGIKSPTNFDVRPVTFGRSNSVVTRPFHLLQFCALRPNATVQLLDFSIHSSFDLALHSPVLVRVVITSAHKQHFRIGNVLREHLQPQPQIILQLLNVEGRRQSACE